MHRARWLRGNAFGRSRVQDPWPANLVEVFSGFLNLKIAKKLVIFKGTCRVGPHIPLLLIRGATAPKSQDRLKRLLPDHSTGGLVVSKELIPQP